MRRSSAKIQNNFLCRKISCFDKFPVLCDGFRSILVYCWACWKDIISVITSIVSTGVLLNGLLFILASQENTPQNTQLTLPLGATGLNSYDKKSTRISEIFSTGYQTKLCHLMGNLMFCTVKACCVHSLCNKLNGFK